MTKTIKIPGPDHPMEIGPAGGRVTVSQDSVVLADTTQALVVREASYAPVYYVPREAVDLSLFERSETTSYCPYKGDCNYYHLLGAGEAGRDIAWTYEAPFDAAQALSHHLAFYANKADVNVVA